MKHGFRIPREHRSSRVPAQAGVSRDGWHLIPLLLSSLLFFPSCAYKRCYQEKFLPNATAPLSIEMPENKLVFENVSALVYDAVWSHFDRVGYHLVDKRDAHYSLQITVKDVSSVYKFLSPDLLTYAERIKVELFCRVVDEQNKVVAKKLFLVSTLLSKAKDHVENSVFSDFEYRRLFEQQAYKIDHYFRPFLQKREQA